MSGLVDLGGELRHPGARRIGRLVQQRIGKADHRVERSTQFVAHGGKETRLRLVRRLRRLLGAAEFVLGGSRLRHVGEGADPAAVRRWVGAEVQHPARPANRLTDHRHRPVDRPQRAEARRRRIAFAEMATHGHGFDQLVPGSSRRQQPWRQLQELGRDRVAGDQARVGSPKHDPVTDVGQHERQLVSTARHLRLCFGQRGDVGHHADIATVRQRCGAHIQRRAIRSPALAHLWAGDVEGHLLGEDLGGGAGSILAYRGTPPDHVFEVIADVQRRAGHDQGVRLVEHRHSTIRTVDANAVRKRLEDGLQQCGAPKCVVLGTRDRADIGKGQGPAAVGQRIRDDVDGLSVGADATGRRETRPIRIALRGNEGGRTSGPAEMLPVTRSGSSRRENKIPSGT